MHTRPDLAPVALPPLFVVLIHIFKLLSQLHRAGDRNLTDVPSPNNHGHKTCP